MVFQAMMGTMYENYGPDTSTGILPMPQILAYYAVFFFFGALYFDCDDQEGQLGRWWRITLPVALLVVFPIGYECATCSFGLTPEWLLQSAREEGLILEIGTVTYRGDGETFLAALKKYIHHPKVKGSCLHRGRVNGPHDPWDVEW